MFRSTLLRGVSARAFALVLASSAADAQEALPTIDISAPTPAVRGGQGNAVGTQDPKAYSRPNATTATKTDTPIMETPISIQVVPHQVLQDQQAVRLDKALENVSGVFTFPTGASWGASADNFIVRGFKVDRVYRDGVLQPKSFVTSTSSNDLADVDHVEVLKGPASILYGRIEPGALVNLVTKEPLAQPFFALEQQIGSFDFYRTTLDAGGPAGKDSGLSYRFNMAYENAGSFVDHADNERVFLAPVLRWDIDPSTQITFNMHYLNSYDPFVNGVPVFGKSRSVPSLPRSTNLYDSPYATVENVLVGYKFSHALNENWTFRQRFSANFLNGDSSGNFPFGSADADGVLSRGVIVERFRDTLYQASADLTGHFTTWEVKHTLLLGADYVNQAPHETYTGLARGTSINIFSGLRQGAVTPLSPAVHFFTHPQWYGLFLQDQIELPHGFHLLAGFRYDDARNPTSVTTEDGSAPKITPSHDSAVNPRFGLLWRPIPELSFYGSYVQNFGLPNGVLWQAGSVPQSLKPETAEQWEGGVKTELFDQRLTASFAYFNLTKQNVATQNPINPLLKDVTGEVRSRGVEMDVAGEVLPGWRIIGGLAFTDAVVTKDTVDSIGNPIGNQGKRFFGVPRVGGSFWTTYEIQDSDWRGLKFGAGVISRGSREGDLANTFQAPGFTVVNAMASYEWTLGPSKVKLQLNVDNLFDRTYFANTDGFNSLVYGTPRRFMGSARVVF